MAVRRISTKNGRDRPIARSAWTPPMPPWSSSSVRSMSTSLSDATRRDFRSVPKTDSRSVKKSHLVAAPVQAGALLINHIAPGNRTLAPSAWGASAARTAAMAAETTSAGWLRSQLLTAPIWVD